jgi:AcrR family transcriptional regulator
MDAVAVLRSGATDTRQRLIDVAVDLFTRYGFAGTSLQMIADELGITKAAIYYHFRTREQLLSAVVEPVLVQLRTIIETAETLRSPHARAEHMLSGYVALAVGNRPMFAVLAGDPSVSEMLRAHREWDDLINRQMALLAGAEPGPVGLVKAAVVLAGIAGAAGPTLVNIDDEALRQHVVDAGRRTLGLRTPRRPVRANSQ